MIRTSALSCRHRGATIGATALWLASFALPWLAWLVFGSRAMRSLESGVTHAHGRSVREAQNPKAQNLKAVDPTLVGHALLAPAAAPVGASAVSALNA